MDGVGLEELRARVPAAWVLDLEEDGWRSAQLPLLDAPGPAGPRPLPADDPAGPDLREDLVRVQGTDWPRGQVGLDGLLARHLHVEPAPPRLTEAQQLGVLRLVLGAAPVDAPAAEQDAD